ncbi:MAG: UbiX family flavin prenyltransferase [Thermoproteota archaeon]
MVAITGASGIVYGLRLAEVLLERGMLEAIIYTESAERVSKSELGISLRERLSTMGVPLYSEKDIDAPYASSSRLPCAMVVAPASTRTLAAIAGGLSDNLVTRAALSMLRLGRKLVLVVRETPLGIAEILNMLKVALYGAVVLPASPGFYSKPQTVEDMVNFVVGKVLDVLGIEHSLYKRWDGRSSQA